jgi:hypothetical protein
VIPHDIGHGGSRRRGKVKNVDAKEAATEQSEPDFKCDLKSKLGTILACIEKRCQDALEELDGT